jgi:hypothetical protein
MSGTSRHPGACGKMAKKAVDMATPLDDRFAFCVEQGRLDGREPEIEEDVAAGRRYVGGSMWVSHGPMPNLRDDGEVAERYLHTVSTSLSTWASRFWNNFRIHQRYESSGERCSDKVTVQWHAATLAIDAWYVERRQSGEHGNCKRGNWTSTVLHVDVDVGSIWRRVATSGRVMIQPPDRWHLLILKTAVSRFRSHDLREGGEM